MMGMGAPQEVVGQQRLSCVCCGSEGSQKEMKEWGLALWGHGPPDSKKADTRNADWSTRNIPWIKAQGEGRQTRTEVTWPQANGVALGGLTCKTCALKVLTHQRVATPRWPRPRAALRS